MNRPLHTEEDLLTALASGSRNATEELYRKHYPVVSKWLMGYGVSEEDAADIFQEGMVVLFEKSVDSDFRLSCKVGTYLLAVCKYIWYKRAERKKKEPVSLSDNTGNDIEAAWIYEDDLKAHEEREVHYRQLGDALNALGEPCAALLKAYYNEDLSMQQIAERFGYTNPDNAKTQKYKCLTRLKKIFFSVSAR